MHEESLRMWVRQAQADAGKRPGAATSDELEELRRFRRENRERTIGAAASAVLPARQGPALGARRRG
ncbi:MAG: hypothetical protein ACSLFR_05555 [Solirubrobacteraceae bacterium]